MCNDHPSDTADEAPRPPLVWIADDSPLEAQIIRRSLGDAYETELFADGSSLLERLASAPRQPDVLLLDWVMPGISGEEVCRFLRAQPHTVDLSILLVTASRIEVGDIVAGLAAGADDYVAKPFAAEELRARLEAMLRAKRLRAEAQLQTRRLQLIAHVARRLAAAGPSVLQVIDALAETLAEVLGDGCLVGAELPEGGGRYLSIGHRSPETRALLGAAAAPWEGPTCDWGPMGDAATVTEAPRVIRVGGRDALRTLVPAPFHPALESLRVEELLLAPLRDRACSRGTVVLWRDASQAPFTNGDRALLDTCLEYGSLAFQNAQLYDAERRARAQAAQAAAERQQVVHFQEQFMGILGHDLRNPLSAITMGVEVLSRRLGSGEAPALRRIKSSTERMKRMVAQLLDLTMARLGGGIIIYPQPVELGVVTREVMEELQVAHPGCTFNTQIDAGITGAWDPDRLEQVISNLTANAIQHGRPGSPVTLSVRRTEAEGVVEVHNHSAEGTAIPAELLPVLFEPFRRGRDEQDNQGLGLGLYITQEIVRAHGGRIEVDSSCEAGTRFRIFLPLGPP